MNNGILENSDITQFSNNNVVLKFDGFFVAVAGDNVKNQSMSFEVSTGFKINSIQIQYLETEFDDFGNMVDVTKTADFIVSNDNLTATYSSGNRRFNGFVFDVSILASEVKITQGDLDNLTAKNLILSIDSVEAVLGDTYSNNNLSLAVVGDFVMFDNSSFLNYQIEGFDDFGNVVMLQEVQNFTYAADYKTASLITSTSDTREYLSIVVDTVADDVPVIVGGNSIYRINKTILKNINNNRFFDTVTGDQLDYGVYILNITSFPFKLPVDVYGEGRNIYLADKNTGIDAVTLLDDEYVLDMGTITVEGDNQNLLDYVGVDCLIHLPYSEPVSIPIFYAMDAVVQIDYVFSAYNTDVTINLRSSKIGFNVFKSVTVTIGVEVPYITTATMLEVKNTDVLLGFDNGVTTPFIEFLIQDKILDDGFFTIPIIDEGILLNEVGYIRVDNIQLEVECFKNEKDELVNLLSSGVIIK